MSKPQVWWSTGQWHVCLTLLMWSSLQTPTNSESGLSSPPICQCSISGYMVEVCHIPCPLDCKLSDWSAWSACSASCGSGLKMRSKWLREKAFNGGRPCPRLDLKNQVRRAPVIIQYIHIILYIVEGKCWCLCCLSLKWKWSRTAMKSQSEPLFDCILLKKSKVAHV